MDIKKAIVLGADNNYRDKLETTIKSICYHNRGLKFYIFNAEMMVNVHKWTTDNICQNLLELTAEKHQEVYGD